MKKSNKKGFTLVELVIVIAVIAILAAVLIPTFTSVIGRANQSAALQKWKAIVDKAYVEYVAEEHEVPKFVNVTTTTVEFEKTGTASNFKTTGTGTYVKLDETNKVFLVFVGESYSVVTGTLETATLTYAGGTAIAAAAGTAV